MQRSYTSTYPFRVKKIFDLSLKERMEFLCLVGGTLFVLTRYLLWWFKPEHIPTNIWSGEVIQSNPLDILLFLLLSFVVFIGWSSRFATWFALWFKARPEPILPSAGLQVAFLTCFVPEKEPLDMLENTLKAMISVRYPHHTWVLDEGDSDGVKALCTRLGVHHFSRKAIARYNQSGGPYRKNTKAGNHNAWRDSHERKYDIVAQVDVDHVPKPDYFEKTLGYFKDRKVAFVGMPEVYGNTQNWIARGAAEQAYFFHGPVQQGYFGCDMPFLIGASHLYRVVAMQSIGGFAPTIVEDHLTGMKLYAQGWKGVFVPKVLTHGEGPLNWVDYFNQQMRWSYGLFEIFFKHTPKLLQRLTWKQRIHYFLAQLYYFSGVAVVTGMILTALYLLYGVNSSSMRLTEWAFYAFPPFLLANLLDLYTHRFHIDPATKPWFGPLGKFLQFGAHLIYAVAFLRFMCGYELRYLVTQKGKTGCNQQIPLTTFTLHLTFAAVMLFAIVWSFITDHSTIQLRLWAVFNCITLTAISLSMYGYNIYEKLKKHTLLYGYFLQGLRSSIVVGCIVLATGFYAYRGVLAAVWRDTFAMQKNEGVLSSGKIPPSTGVYLGVSLYQHNDWNILDDLEKTTKKHFALVGFYQPWGVKNNQFNFLWASHITDKGSVPFITWEPWQPLTGFDHLLTETNQSNYRLKYIINGDYDVYIHTFAKDIKSFSKPIMLRFAHEMNGNWYPWGTGQNLPEEYVAAWRHVHNIFDLEGVTNVSWVWAPNEIYDKDQNIGSYYPGDEYVDWVGFSAFNWAGRYKNNYWREPNKLFDFTTQELKKFHKPILISETASADVDGLPGMKARWISSLATYIENEQAIKGVIWFNAKDSGIDWTLNSTSTALESFTRSFTGTIFIQYPSLYWSSHWRDYTYSHDGIEIESKKF